MIAAPNEQRIAKILVVDDNASMRLMIRSVLLDLAGEIIEASSGVEAIEAYSMHKPDWVTLDVAMQPMDGLTASRAIRAIDPHARLVIITSYDNKVFRDAAQRLGAAGFVIKENLWRVREIIAPANRSTEAAGDPSASDTPGSTMNTVLAPLFSLTLTGLCKASGLLREAFRNALRSIATPPSLHRNLL